MVDSKILIVEDDFIVAIDLKQHLEKIGYKVLEIADNGIDAIKKTQEKNPDLILMDISLKGDMDGIDAAEQIHKLCNTPLIYLSGYVDEKTKRRANITNPLGYIVKPFVDKEIKNIIGLAV
jgi:two-component system, response regulator PdtaR